MSLVESRRHQMFPVLDSSQIETAKRFASGQARHFAPGEVIYAVGERQAPAWLVMEGTIEVARRDGLDHEAPITIHRVGHKFPAKSASLPDVPRWPPAAPALGVAGLFPSTPPTCARL
jgi:hypothetical protein